MIELFAAPNVYGRKVLIVLEETGLPYVVRAAEPVDVRRAVVDPLGRAPSIHDPQGPDGLPIALGESGAIAFYLARKAHKLGPESARETAEFEYFSYAIAATLSPQFAVLAFLKEQAAQNTTWAASAFQDNARRVFRNFEERLATRHFLAGERFTILDALLYPHIALSAGELLGGLGEFPNLDRYRDRIGRREGVRRAMEIVIR